MSTDPAVQSGRRETLTLGAAAIAAFVLTEYITGPVLQVYGMWRHPLWFTLGLVLLVVFVLLFTYAAERVFGPAEKEEFQ
jgi:uncharacterized membrane protein YhdT